MELRSRRLIASGEARRRARLGFTPSEPDHISTLPDELLLQVLARLGCVATAARTSVLARRWRGLWTHLLDLAFPDAPFRSLGKALDALGRKDAVVSSFDIRVADQPGSTRAVSSLLRAAAWFLPVDLAVTVPSGVAHLRHPVELPCFGFERTATISLVMDGNPVELRLPTSAALAAANVGECLFPALTTLDLCGYYTHDGLAALLPHCPLLCVLRYAVRYHRPCDQDYAITIHSPTLRELVVEESGEDYVHRIDIAAPALEQLTVSFDAREDLTVSVLAPMAEKVSWRCRYDGGWFTGFGCWEIEKVSLISPSPLPAPTAETRRPTLLRIDACKGSGDYWFIKADDYPADHLEQELEKHLQQQVAADLSAMDLELHLTPLGHVYGAFVLHLLGTRPVRTAARSFKLALLMPERREDVEGCETFTLTDVPPMEGCYCEPSWRSEAICSTELEEVEIDGFRGDDHEFGFLEMVFRCAPMLRRMTVKQSNEVAPSDEKIQDIFKAHPFVECQYVLSS